jgi:ketosteroid isomerase-like protein
VAHEYHSFADTSAQDAAAGEAAVRAVHARWSERTAAGDLDGLMEHIAPDVVSYEHGGPLKVVGRDAVREVCRSGLEASAGPAAVDTPELTVRVGGTSRSGGGWCTCGPRPRRLAGRLLVAGHPRLRPRADGWEVVHQHLSFPVAAADVAE